MSNLLVGKKLGEPFLRKTVFFLHFLGSPEIFLASKTLFGIRNLNGLKVENSIFWRNPPWESLKPLLGSKNLRSMIPLKVGVSDANLGFGGQKIFGEPQKMKKNCFSQKWSNQFFFQQTNLTLVNLMGGGFGFEPRD